MADIPAADDYDDLDYTVPLGASLLHAYVAEMAAQAVAEMAAQAAAAPAVLAGT